MNAARIWVENRRWHVILVQGRLCSAGRCGRKAVAELRRTTRKGSRCYAYCTRHLHRYDCRVLGGKVMALVDADSSAVQRGYVE